MHGVVVGCQAATGLQGRGESVIQCQASLVTDSGSVVCTREGFVCLWHKTRVHVACDVLGVELFVVEQIFLFAYVTVSAKLIKDIIITRSGA